MFKHNFKKGFTLIELLVVVAIIGLISTIATVAINSARIKARDAKRVNNINQIQTALELYNAERVLYPTGANLTLGEGTSCSGAACLVLSANGFSNTAPGAGVTVYMGLVPKNPIPNGTSYVYNQTGSGSGYTIIFTLEGSTGSLPAGARTASESGIR